MSTSTKSKPSVSSKYFGTLLTRNGDSKKVQQFTIQNSNGMIIELLEYGAAIKSIIVPTPSGNVIDVCPGFDDLESYAGKREKLADGTVEVGPITSQYLGATNGRVAARVTNGKFTLNGEEFCLVQNSGRNALHGGIEGFDKKHWQGTIISDRSVCFTYLSPDKEEGYPGDVMVSALFTLNDDNGIEIHYSGMASKTTLLHLSNHTFFNLCGHDKSTLGGLYDHEFKANAEEFLPFTDDFVPIGEVRKVSDTPSEECSDFRSFKRLGDVIPRCRGGDLNGYTMSFVINQNTASDKNGLKLGCTLKNPKSPITMECWTNQPCVLIYTGNFLPKDKSMVGKEGACYQRHGCFCLQTEGYQDSINNPSFPQAGVLKPGEVYDHRIIFKFVV